MRQDKRIYVSVFWLILGAVLIALSFAGNVDSYWNGLGTGLAIIGAIQILRYYRLNNNQEYRERRKIEETDERNAFIRNKAFAWAGYVFILSVSILILVLKIANQDIWATAASMAVCYMLILFWGAYKILQRKY